MTLSIVKPNYPSIASVCEICEPWIENWSGDEWGESMRALLSACHTSYAFSDEDCALFANKILYYLGEQYQWVKEEGYQYGFADNLEAVRAEAIRIRDDWEKRDSAKESINQLPKWLFEAEEYGF